MSKLAEAIAAYVERDVAAEIASLSSERRECRAVFYGPPPRLLNDVFLLLGGDGRLLRAAASDGTPIDYPVVLQVEELPTGSQVATPLRSGKLLFQQLANFRNDRGAGVFLALVPPTGQASDTHESTRKPIGVNPSVYEGSASVGEWWNDAFIQRLVADLLDGTHGEASDARELLRVAAVAADAVAQHAANKEGPWEILERAWTLKGMNLSLDQSVCLAAGFPPSASGAVDADVKQRVLSAIVDKLEEVNFGGALDYFVAKARDDSEKESLQACLLHIRGKCEALTALRRTISHCYSVDDITAVPRWWAQLTTERWLELLDDVIDGPQPTGTVRLSCANPLVSHLKGFVPVVRDVVKIRIDVPVELEGYEVLVTREVAGGPGNRRQWIVPAMPIMEIEDDSVPSHRTPARYSAEVVGSTAKKGTLKLISLASWEPGVIVCSRTATKGTPPKAARGVAYETSLSMTGHGRHYLDLYFRPGTEPARDTALLTDDANPAGLSIDIARVADNEFGLEMELSGESQVLIPIRRPGRSGAEDLRVTLIAEEASPDECESYFALLMLRNSRRDGGRQPRSVQVNGQMRCAQLQAWMLDAASAKRSFYPVVLADDYSKHWTRRIWESSDETVFSGGKFLNDPRPAFNDMRPPESFTSAREAIAERIRGEDGNDLVEAAPLGEWLVSDPAFATLVDQYVQGYAQWLASSPNEASWCDLAIVTRFESDGVTLLQEPDAIVVSPLHPIRFAWQCLAQRTMYLAQRKRPCPAASILDPDCVPDSLALPLRTASHEISNVLFFSVECTSDYWGILWNANRLDLLGRRLPTPPLDREMGLLVGGISSGFSVSQVHRAMDDIRGMLVAKPALGVLISSSAGQNNACNEGVIAWGRKHFSSSSTNRDTRGRIGASEVHVLDERRPESRPNDAEISNLAEDTNSAIQWYAGFLAKTKPDLAIIAQLETSNATHLPTKLATALGTGGLVRTRIRQQLPAAAGQLLCESRMAAPPGPTGDGLADALAKAIADIENLAESRSGYVFAPSLHAVRSALEKAEFAAVSSSVVDPACFLGNWLEGTYLWDYELPSYSGRSGDSNGYYLLSAIKELDLETMRIVLSRLPDCGALPEEQLAAIVQEVARRGIPTVRGLSAGDSGATGDLGLLVATRVLQGMGPHGHALGLLRPWVEERENEVHINLIIPVDPFQGYLDDLAKAASKESLHRPDILVVGLHISDASVRCKLTPIEVKNRSGIAPMPSTARAEALAQAKSLSSLLLTIEKASDDGELLLWRLAYQNLLTAMLGYGFRVYSQLAFEAGRSGDWAALQSRALSSILSSEMSIEVDERGRLFVIDGSRVSGSKDTDGDGFSETIELSQADASLVVRGEAASLVASIRSRIGDWNLLPAQGGAQRIPVGSAPSSEPPPVPTSPTIPTTEAGVQDDGGAPVAVPSIQEPIPEDYAHQPGLSLRVGEPLDGFDYSAKYLNLGDTALNQLNVGVVGDLGTGKTQLLKSLVYQISRGVGNRGVRPNILIFDYKKDYSADEFVQAVGARVVRPQHIPLNLFDLSGAAHSVAPWLDRFRFFADALDKIYKGIGPVQRQRLKDAVRESYSQAGPDSSPTIYDVHRNYGALKGGADVVTSILGDLIDIELFAPDPGKLMRAEEFLKGVVVVSLHDLGQDDKTKNMLVAIMLNVFYENMLRIEKRPFLGEHGDRRVVDSMLLVDEADNIMEYEFEVLRKILLQGREFGVGTILASQYLSHFKQRATDYREPLLTWFLHKVPNLRAAELSSLGLSDGNELAQYAERVKTLGLHECLYKSHDAPGEFIRGAPFYQRAEWDLPNPKE